MLEYAPPAPSPPTAAHKSPLSPSRASSNSLLNRASPGSVGLKPALKSPSSASKRLADENASAGVRFVGSSSPNTWEGAVEASTGEQQEAASVEAQGLSRSTSQEQDVSMDLQSEDGTADFRALRGGGGGPLSASTSHSSLSSSDRERVPLHGELFHPGPRSRSSKSRILF